jgi:integrase
MKKLKEATMVIDKKFSKRFQREMWGYDGRVEGVRKRDYRFFTKKEAETAWAALVTKSVNEEYGIRERGVPTTITMALEEYKKRYALKSQSKDVGYQQNMTATFNRIEEFIDQVGSEKLVRKITINDLHQWSNQMASRGVSQGSISTYAGRLSGMLKLAKTAFSDLGDWTVPKVSEFAPSPGNRRERIIKPEEAYALVQALLNPPRQGRRMTSQRYRHLVDTARDAADTFRIALATGKRLNEILKRQLSDFKGDKIVIEKTKSKKDRTIPLPASVAAVVEARIKDGLTRNNQLFPRRFENRSYVSLLNDTMHRVATRAGLNYGRANDGFTVHDARATYITSLLRGNPEKGIPAISMGTVMSRSGHKSLSGFQHYVRMVEEEQETATAAAESLVEQYMSGVVPQPVASIGTNKTIRAKTKLSSGANKQKKRRRVVAA